MRKNISSLMTSKNILIALTVLCCFFIGTSFFTDTLTKPLKKCVSMVVVPVQKGMNNIGFWVYDKYQTLQEISVVLDENKKLQSQVDDLTEENNQLKQDSYELNRLRDLYELDQQYAGYSKVGARVIEVTTDNWHSSFKIDKGTDDGLKVNMNVIASGGLVGIISETGSNYSIVKTFTENKNLPPVVITDFMLFNKEVRADEENTPLDKSITFSDSITLQANQNSFSFRIAALGYQVPKMNKLMYRLDGFDKDWITVGESPIVTYSNLWHGDYQFRVKASNSDGIWGPEEQLLYIHILSLIHI